MTTPTDTMNSEYVLDVLKNRILDCEYAWSKELGSNEAGKDHQGRKVLDAVAAVYAERDALRASRIACASEFPDGSEGIPDVGSVHQNIRVLKAERDALLDIVKGLSDALRSIKHCTMSPCTSEEWASQDYVAGWLDAFLRPHMRSCRSSCYSEGHTAGKEAKKALARAEARSKGGAS